MGTASTATSRPSSNGGGRSRAEQDPIVRRMKEKFGAEIQDDYRLQRETVRSLGVRLGRGRLSLHTGRMQWADSTYRN